MTIKLKTDRFLGKYHPRVALKYSSTDFKGSSFRPTDRIIGRNESTADEHLKAPPQSSTEKSVVEPIRAFLQIGIIGSLGFEIRPPDAVLARIPVKLASVD